MGLAEKIEQDPSLSSNVISIVTQSRTNQPQTRQYGQGQPMPPQTPQYGQGQSAFDWSLSPQRERLMKTRFFNDFNQSTSIDKYGCPSVQLCLSYDMIKPRIDTIYLLKEDSYDETFMKNLNADEHKCTIEADQIKYNGKVYNSIGTLVYENVNAVNDHPLSYISIVENNNEAFTLKERYDKVLDIYFYRLRDDLIRRTGVWEVARMSECNMGFVVYVNERQVLKQLEAEYNNEYIKFILKEGGTDLQQECDIGSTISESLTVPSREQ